ncbi:MAG TPA: tetratricopeptide repeat protein [Sphingomicrobium sp.]|nr:tetratricopeptide repeat protein [Sphingomicrobium sp.]
MSLFARMGGATIPTFLATALLFSAAPVLPREEGQVPGAMTDPLQQQGQPQAQSNAPRPSGSNGEPIGAPKARAYPQDPAADTPARAIERGDFATALRLARPRALAGDASAQHVLGYLYETGSGVPLDYEIAASWNRKAAEQGNAGGQADLGWMYFKGLGVPRDPVQAYKWLVLAGREDMTARRHMKEVEAAITHDQMSQGLSLAQQWIPVPEKH